jgi:hypothetical protein
MSDATRRWSVDAEAARLTGWLRSAEVVRGFPTPLHKELFA